MPNKKNPPHILPTLICLLLVLGLNSSCSIGYVEFHTIKGTFSSDPQGPLTGGEDVGDLADFFIWVQSADDHLVKTDTKGENIETLPSNGAVEDAKVIPAKTTGTSSSLRLGLTAAGAGAQPAADVAAEEPRLILVGRTTVQILNLGTNTLGASVPLSGQFGQRVAVSGDGAFAAVTVGSSGVDLIDLDSMTRTGTIELPTDCKPRGIAFLPGTNDFAVACTGDGAIRFYSVNGGAGSGPIRELTGCEGARAVVFTADGQRGLFSCTSSVWVYDVLADSVVHTIEGFDSVQAMATAMDATRAYITNTSGGGARQLIVVDLATYGIIRTTEVGGFPGTVAVGPDDLRVYVLGEREGEGRGIVITDKEGVELGFAPAPDFPITFLVVRLPNPA